MARLPAAYVAGYAKARAMNPVAGRRIYTTGFACESPPDADSATMANALMQAIPGVARITDPEEHKQVVELAYRLSRALIGNRLAGSFGYPKRSTLGALFVFRLKQRLRRFVKRDDIVRSGNFAQLSQISVYDEAGLSYRMPDHVHTAKWNPW